MNSNKRKTTIAGTLYILGTAAGVLSIAPAIDAPDYLIKASANANQVMIAVLFQFIMTIAYLGFAITLYPILRKYKESLALGFLSFRIIASILNIIGFIILLLLLSLSQEFVKVETPDLSYYKTLGDLMRTGRDFVNHFSMIVATSVGGLMFYLLLYQIRIILRWLSLWGFLGNVLTISACILLLFHKIEIISFSNLVLNLPLILLEIIFAGWLIFKGFNLNTTNSIPEIKQIS